VTTGYVYHPSFLEHDLPGHPENARRLRHVMDLLEQAGVLELLIEIEPRLASVDELARVHEVEHIERVRRIAEQGGGALDPDTYANSSSFRVASLAAGGLLSGVEAMFAGEVENCFALVRPPGHHATPSRAMGFCLFNNVAVAARHALDELGAERVFVVDFDVHHGNGTQDIFDHDPQVFYLSTHEYPFYPGTGHWNDAGLGEGAGTVLDVPLPAGVGDAGYAQVFRELVGPAATRFAPDLILVSAGYDAHWEDPLAMMLLSLEGYAHMSRELVHLAQDLCQGRILFALEGGYHLDVLAHGVLNTFYTLMGEEKVSDPLGPCSTEEQDIEGIVSRLAEYHNLA
jgi:acetoin utilization deacetylase AcuC-like enzyme